MLLIASCTPTKQTWSATFIEYRLNITKRIFWRDVFQNLIRMFKKFKPYFIKNNANIDVMHLQILKIVSSLSK